MCSQRDHLLVHRQQVWHTVSGPVGFIAELRQRLLHHIEPDCRIPVVAVSGHDHSERPDFHLGRNCSGRNQAGRAALTSIAQPQRPKESARMARSGRFVFPNPSFSQTVAERSHYTPAAKRRHRKARHGSAGCGREKRTESRRDGTLSRQPAKPPREYSQGNRRSSLSHLTHYFLCFRVVSTLVYYLGSSRFSLFESDMRRQPSPWE